MEMYLITEKEKDTSKPSVTYTFIWERVHNHFVCVTVTSSEPPEKALDTLRALAEVSGYRPTPWWKFWRGDILSDYVNAVLARVRKEDKGKTDGAQTGTNDR